MEDDPELLDYQKSKSTPKIVIQEFEEAPDNIEKKKEEAHKKNELFSQVIPHYPSGLTFSLVLWDTSEREVRQPKDDYSWGVVKA